MKADDDAKPAGDRSRFTKVAAPAGWAGGKVRTLSDGKVNRRLRRIGERRERQAAAKAEINRIVTIRNTQPGAREWAAIRRVRGA